ncbi:D-alanyl-D-alanine carboxypeptidase family protein [Moraxella sp. ZY210820]|uniref:D-alanyl-D-alanine carboxypeptidase family protein n=1 Tax=unclassified Moraxella TaxID=2685852 RepID=UPI0027313F58|nr:D-alanyl-D-alanine carboxypeptidase family protein [Moraxella sp. ZY210820]WLF83895.1 D-alanyl-D-alanine carboxypeptidase [Moraxella sp. ZY210820]
MLNSKLVRCTLAAALLTASTGSFADIVIRSGQGAIWSADEADKFLNNNEVPQKARIVTSTTMTSTPVSYQQDTNTYSYNNNSYNNSYTNSNYTQYQDYSAYKPEVNARAALVMDATTGEVLYSKNTESVRSIASITKLMTAMVTLDANLNLYEQITLTSSDFAGAGGKNSSSTLRVGDTMTRSDALYLALMKSENPAAMALSRTYPGGRNAFIAAMNNKAASLGMYSSNFTDPSGLDPKNVSSARDLGILTSSAARYGTIRHFSTSASNSFNLGYRMLTSNNTNAIVRNGGWSLDVSKTGYIKEAGRCVVMQANINSRPVVVVLLGGSDSAARTQDATRLFNWVAQQPQRF